jgi:hypothetical protein
MRSSSLALGVLIDPLCWTATVSRKRSGRRALSRKIKSVECAGG